MFAPPVPQLYLSLYCLLVFAATTHPHTHTAHTTNNTSARHLAFTISPIAYTMDLTPAGTQPPMLTTSSLSADTAIHTLTDIYGNVYTATGEPWIFEIITRSWLISTTFETSTSVTPTPTPTRRNTQVPWDGGITAVSRGKTYTMFYLTGETEPPKPTTSTVPASTSLSADGEYRATTTIDGKTWTILHNTALGEPSTIPLTVTPTLIASPTVQKTTAAIEGIISALQGLDSTSSCDPTPIASAAPSSYANIGSSPRPRRPHSRSPLRLP